jgi:hypothetical protein
VVDGYGKNRVKREVSNMCKVYVLVALLISSGMLIGNDGQDILVVLFC